MPDTTAASCKKYFPEMGKYFLSHIPDPANQHGKGFGG